MNQTRNLFLGANKLVALLLDLQDSAHELVLAQSVARHGVGYTYSWEVGKSPED